MTWICCFTALNLFCIKLRKSQFKCHLPQWLKLQRSYTENGTQKMNALLPASMNIRLETNFNIKTWSISKSQTKLYCDVTYSITILVIHVVCLKLKCYIIFSDRTLGETLNTLRDKAWFSCYTKWMCMTGILQHCGLWKPARYKSITQGS